MLLRAGVAHVVAVDVGYGQLAWSLQSDERVTVKDRTNVRELTVELIDGVPADLVVGDLSFISIGLVLPALVRCCAPDADLVLMVKPQFEVGKDRLGSGGVVRSPELRAEAVREVAAKAWKLGLGVLGVTASPLPGPSGNVEYFLWLRAGAPALDPGTSIVQWRRGRSDRYSRHRRIHGFDDGGGARGNAPSSCSPTPDGRRPSAAPSWSSRDC